MNNLNHVMTQKTNLEYVRNIEMVMKLKCIMPMLKVVYAFIKLHRHITHLHHKFNM